MNGNDFTSNKMREVMKDSVKGAGQAHHHRIRGKEHPLHFSLDLDTASRQQWLLGHRTRADVTEEHTKQMSKELKRDKRRRKKKKTKPHRPVEASTDTFDGVSETAEGRPRKIVASSLFDSEDYMRRVSQLAGIGKGGCGGSGKRPPRKAS